jgi:hypothetical protein
MPLPSPVARTAVHTREVVCGGWRRDDGLWDIEAHMTDRKCYATHNDHRSVSAGAPFHAMALRVTMDDALLIHDVSACIDAAPFRLCPAIAREVQCLVGLRIGGGFMTELRRQLGGVRGCTHLVELFGPLATTAIQTVHPLRRTSTGRETDRPAQIDGCHALAASGEVVAKYWPGFHQPAH